MTLKLQQIDHYTPRTSQGPLSAHLGLSSLSTPGIPTLQVSASIFFRVHIQHQRRFPSEATPDHPAIYRRLSIHHSIPASSDPLAHDHDATKPATSTWTLSTSKEGGRAPNETLTSYHLLPYSSANQLLPDYGILMPMAENLPATKLLFTRWSCKGGPEQVRHRHRM